MIIVLTSLGLTTQDMNSNSSDRTKTGLDFFTVGDHHTKSTSMSASHPAPGGDSDALYMKDMKPARERTVNTDYSDLPSGHPKHHVDIDEDVV